MHLRRARALLVATALALTACAYNATLPQQESRLRSADGLSECDRKIDPQRHQILLALEERKAAIAAFVPKSKSTSEQAKFRTLQIGIASFRQRIDSPPPKDEWIETRKSWDQVYQLYLSTKDLPMGSPWLELNREARALLFDDLRRLVAHVDYSLDETSRKPLQAAIKDVQRCLEKSDCAALDAEQPSAIWIAQRPLFREAFSRWQDNRSGELLALKKLLAQLKIDLRSHYQLRPNRNVWREGNVLMLTVDPGPFAGAEDRLGALIETMWTGSKLSVRLDWASGSKKPATARFVFSTEPGERAHEHRESRDFTTITLSSGDAVTVAHEFGHVLGFPDHYFTRWDDSRCEYVTRKNGADLMSGDHEPGAAVTAAEWNSLERAYPERAQPETDHGDEVIDP